MHLQPLQVNFPFERHCTSDQPQQAQRQGDYGSATGSGLGSNRGPASLRPVKRQRHHTPSIRGSSMAAPRC
jgi:hypothetical protein